MHILEQIANLGLSLDDPVPGMERTETEQPHPDASLRALQQQIPDCTYHVDIPLAGVCRALHTYGIRVPDYQRPPCWSLEQQEAYMGTLLQAPRMTPAFWFNWVAEGTDDRACAELVDGQQRLIACVNFLRGIIGAVPFTGDRQRIWYHRLQEQDRRNLSMSTTLSWNFIQQPRAGVLRFYLALNSGGTVHTSSELQRVADLLREAQRTA